MFFCETQGARGTGAICSRPGVRAPGVRLLEPRAGRFDDPRVSQKNTRFRMEREQATSDSDFWPFADPRNVAVFTTKRIASGAEPILRVSHDSDDGAWQFIGHGELTEESASVVALATIVALDPSIAVLADLPLGWIATRDSRGGTWRRAKHD